MTAALVMLLFAGIGGVARHVLDTLLSQAGVLIANIVGSALAAILAALALVTNTVTEDIQLIMVTGFGGALTTFSTVSVYSAEKYLSGRWLAAAGNWFAHMGGSLAAGTLVFGIILMLG